MPTKTLKVDIKNWVKIQQKDKGQKLALFLRNKIFLTPEELIKTLDEEWGRNLDFNKTWIAHPAIPAPIEIPELDPQELFLQLATSLKIPQQQAKNWLRFIDPYNLDRLYYAFIDSLENNNNSINFTPDRTVQIKIHASDLPSFKEAWEKEPKSETFQQVTVLLAKYHNPPSG